MREYTPDQISKTDDPLIITLNSDFTVTASAKGQKIFKQPVIYTPIPNAPGTEKQTAGAGSNVPATPSSESTLSSAESTSSN